MSALAGAVETAPVSSLHSVGSANPDDFAVPTGREEEWRFTPLNRLRGLHKDAAFTGAVNVTVEAAPEVTVDKLDLSERGRLAPSVLPFAAMDRVSARAYAAAVSATVISVPKEAVASAPTYVRVTGNGTDAAAAGHLIIDVQPYGRATVVIDQTGSATYANNVEIHVADGGDLTVVVLADWADDTVQVAQHVATLGRDAHLAHFAVTLGGSVVRLSPTVRYAGPGGDAELHGIAFADAGQHLEHRLFVDHDTPKCRSRVGYKHALSGDGARTVWIGDVLIRPEATGTDTYEYNRNLVLTDGAHADSVPNLEILTGEVVGAGHASTSGRLDDEHIFYLQARGIPFDEARRLVIRGFFGELIARIGVPELEERITTAIEEELA
ncbi:MAG: Fe-S cluster assembly protein SufD [Trebonia sp.]|jgi:Fe-S cluster assembly protein SufD|nr:Fe-S cluster assembly protein SufD [Trebonia sp.]